MSFLIRLATQADAPQAVRVVKAVYDEYGFSWDAEDYHADLYDLQSHYFDAGHRFWVAEQNNVVLATVGLHLFRPLTGEVGQIVEHENQRRIGGTDCSLERLYVHPEARKAGIGQALMRTVTGEAKSAGKRTMEIWSDKRFEAAHRLYQRFGAEVIADRICDDPDESPEWGLLIRLY
ncbi:MAG: hypothetical protein BGO01_00905 [Armatimonadetes bacterium 55-13]|nr:GNAT family N-acetyltransferase [Armatimonadota bacterium]OJU62364.1 MAG: hypothetical protein BGO01_00905 [Armatimonadetes bacterium 55-13]